MEGIRYRPTNPKIAELKVKSILPVKFFQSRKQLEARLVQQLSRGDRQFYPTVSGRVAIYKAAQAFRRLNAEATGNNIALIPDYICNIVEIALNQAGYQCRSYPTDKFLEPDIERLMREIDHRPPALLLTASIFGSSGMLPALARADLRALLSRLKTNVIVDLCQDISLIDHLPDGYGDRLIAVVSFNNKSFRGMMGGGLLSRINIPAGRRMTLAEQLRLLREFRKYRRQQQQGGSASDTGFEHSQAAYFPFTIEDIRVSKWQILAALTGLADLRRLNDCRAKNLTKIRGVLQTDNAKTAAYLMIDTESESEIDTANRDNPICRRKASYAIHQQPQRSLRPDLRIIQNSGYEGCGQ